MGALRTALRTDRAEVRARRLAMLNEDVFSHRAERATFAADQEAQLLSTVEAAVRSEREKHAISAALEAVGRNGDLMAEAVSEAEAQLAGQAAARGGAEAGSEEGRLACQLHSALREQAWVSIATLERMERELVNASFSRAMASFPVSSGRSPLSSRRSRACRFSMR